jgi:hypothetical protein
MADKEETIRALSAKLSAAQTVYDQAIRDDDEHQTDATEDALAKAADVVLHLQHQIRKAQR